jgi:polyferredoxin
MTKYLALAFTIAVIGLSLLWPVVGLAVPALVILAVVTNAFKHNWFCSNACPRAKILGGFFRRISRNRPTPPSLYTGQMRMVLCGALLFCSISQVSRYWKDLPRLGLFFWAVCVVSLAFAIVFALLYRPRSWCALCPVGTLQRSFRRIKND